MNKPLILAYFLPQFHECDYNNKWWGKGFTEWDNVKAARPLFNNHIQPKVPLNGYYDLSSCDNIVQQFEEANTHGIDGLVFYDYWYLGERLLKRPIDLILKEDLNVKFSVCWANHSWTKSWKNRKGALDVLIEQQYEDNDTDLYKYFDHLNKLFSHKGYIKVNNKCLYQIYNPTDIPNIESFTEKLRKYSLEEYNNEVSICAIINAWKKDYSYLNHFDSYTFFQPSVALWCSQNVFSSMDEIPFSKKKLEIFIRDLPLPIKKVFYTIQDIFFNQPQSFDYDVIWKKIIQQSKHQKFGNVKFYPAGFVDFDNTPRYRKRAKYFIGFSPEKFGYYVEQLLKATPSEVVFLNAWNEWGEGMYLQPDIKFSNQRLEILKHVLEDAR